MATGVVAIFSHRGPKQSFFEHFLSCTWARTTLTPFTDVQNIFKLFMRDISRWYKCFIYVWIIYFFWHQTFFFSVLRKNLPWRSFGVHITNKLNLIFFSTINLFLLLNLKKKFSHNFSSFSCFNPWHTLIN